MHRFGDTPEMATNAPHPARPRTRDNNDPAVIRNRELCLAGQIRRRQEQPDEYLRQKREYNARHKAERAAYDRRRYAAKKAAKEALEFTPIVSVM